MAGAAAMNVRAEHADHVTQTGYIRPMLRIHTAERLDPLVHHLAGVLAHPQADPMSREWIASPSQAMQRWLSLELASRLGSDGPGQSDGVSANIRFAYPGSLLARVLESVVDGDQPWEVERLAWVTLAALHDSPVDSGAGSRYGRARRIADLFDRYNLHRPEMIRQWAAGHDTDESGSSLPAHQLWQPTLWRRVRELIGVPSPAEIMPEILERLRSGDIDPDLPDRLFMFGLTVIPGGPGFIDLAEAVGTQRDLHLYLVQPSAAAAHALEGHHPLLASWARPSISTAQILHASGHPTQPIDSSPPGPETRLGRLQAAVRSNAQPADAHANPGDDSIQLHACYGTTRQVHALRDSILGLLAADPTLQEDDILVLTPALEAFAPIVEAVFGPPAQLDDPPSATSLRYRIADRSIRFSNPVLAAVTTLLDLSSGRFEVDTVLDFIGLAPVRQRFGLSADDLADITRWAEATNIKWGLDSAHRERHGLPAEISTNTWRAAVDQLLVGSTVMANESGLAIGNIAPEGIEGSLNTLATKLAAIVDELSAFAAATATSKPLDEWIQLLIHTQHALLAAPRNQSWQVDNFTAVLTELGDQATSTPDLTFDDFRRAVSGRLEGRSGRPDFFRGGITITSMRPMRWIPHRVICILGIDQGGFSGRSSDGDDLMALSPRPGDFDPQGEARQEVLEAVMAAGDQLVIFRNGHDIRTNVEIPRPTVIEELIDATAPGLSPEIRDGIEIRHPRQAFDERYFTPGGLVPGKVVGFDPDAYQGAQARRSRGPRIPTDRSVPALDQASDMIELAELRALLANASRHHTDRVLQLRLPRASEPLSSMMPIEPDPLQRWTLGEEMIRAAIGDADRTFDESIDRVTAHQRRKGSIPPAGLGDVHAGVVGAVAQEVLTAANDLGVARGPATDIPIDLELGDGTRIVGVVQSRLGPPGPGPAKVTFSSWKAREFAIIWLDLMCLVAAQPEVPWRAVTINPIDTGQAKGAEVWEITPEPGSSADRQATATNAIETVVECLRAGLIDPIPLFPEVSRGFYMETHPGSDLARPGALKNKFNISTKWADSRTGRGDRSDPSTNLLWGEYDIDGLRAMPDGGAQFWADLIWGTIDDSIIITSPGDTPT